MMPTKQASETAAQSAFRQAYVTPQLIAYGLVRELTAGGSKGSNEASPTGMNTMRVRI